MFRLWNEEFFSSFDWSSPEQLTINTPPGETFLCSFDISKIAAAIHFETRKYLLRIELKAE
jgi:hypothetical protein